MDSSADDELFNPPQRDEDPHIYRVLGQDFVVRMPNSDTNWQMGPIQKEKYRTYGESITVEDLSVLCIATQVWGPSVGRRAVMKLKDSVRSHSGSGFHFYNAIPALTN